MPSAFLTYSRKLDIPGSAKDKGEKGAACNWASYQWAETSYKEARAGILWKAVKKFMNLVTLLSSTCHKRARQ